MGELLTFTPRAVAAGTRHTGLPATIVIFPGVRYERGKPQVAKPLVALDEPRKADDGKR